MPELPEVETMRRGIEPAVGHRITELRCPKSRLRPIRILPRLSDFRRRVVGARITSAGRLGKRVVLELDSGDRIVLEPRMSGLVLLDHPPDLEHLRVVFGLSGRPARQILFWSQRGLGTVRLVSPRTFHRQYGPDKVGPDALEITAEMLQRPLRASRRAIKVALLDQRVLAGVGNLYACEILHRARISPELPSNRLHPAHLNRLHAAIREVLQEAIACQGSTLRDGTYRLGPNQPGGYQIRHRVYRRAGQPCLQCGRTNIRRIVQAQRSTFYCPVCQPPPRVHQTVS